MVEKKILLLEAFNGGSHKYLVDYLQHIVQQDDSDSAADCVTMSDKKWHWRMRTSAMYFADNIPCHSKKYSCVFATSVINFAELLGLRPELINAHKILYFHENQLIYPVRKQQERDFQYGYNQILSCLVADTILFNSNYNMKSFLSNIASYLKLMPDYRPKNVKERIAPKCHVLYYPLKLEFPIRIDEKSSIELGPLHIVWAHRWEHDKNPQAFFEALFKLHEDQLSFHVSVLGQSYSDNPEIFSDAQKTLEDHIINWGFLESKEVYLNVLRHADVAISTANHEFFGVSMLEAVSLGCYPLCPNRLVYPEIFPATYLYNTNQQLFRKLRDFCRRPDLVRKHKVEVDMSKYDGEKLKSQYLRHLMK